MRLARAEVGGAPRVLVEIDGTYALATVQGEEFEDLPALLSAGGAIEPGAEAQPGELLPVVGRPGKVICVGLNYAAHAAETGRPPPEYPMLFPKWHTSLTGPNADVPLPPESQKVDWEAELAFVFGKPARRVSAENAADVVFGFTPANDV